MNLQVCQMQFVIFVIELHNANIGLTNNLSEIDLGYIYSSIIVRISVRTCISVCVCLCEYIYVCVCVCVGIQRVKIEIGDSVHLRGDSLFHY